MAARIFLSLSEEQLQKFETEREKLGMNRSRYLQYLINGQTELRPVPLKYRELVGKLSEIERDLKIIALRPDLTQADVVLLFQKISDIETLIRTGDPDKLPDL